LPEKDRKEKEIAARACRQTHRRAPTLKSPYFKIGFWDGLSPKVGGGLFFVPKLGGETKEGGQPPNGDNDLP